MYHSNQPRVAVDDCARLANNGIESHESRTGYKEWVCGDVVDVPIAAGSWSMIGKLKKAGVDGINSWSRSTDVTAGIGADVDIGVCIPVYECCSCKWVVSSGCGSMSDQLSKLLLTDKEGDDLTMLAEEEDDDDDCFSCCWCCINDDIGGEQAKGRRHVLALEAAVAAAFRPWTLKWRRRLLTTENRRLHPGLQEDVQYKFHVIGLYISLWHSFYNNITL